MSSNTNETVAGSAANPKTTHVVYNTTTQGAVSKHESQADAQKEADNLNHFHNNNLFQVRSTNEADKVAKELGDQHVNVAVGDGTQHARFQGAVVDNESPLDKSQIEANLAAVQNNVQNDGKASGPVTDSRNKDLAGAVADAQKEAKQK